MEHRVPPVPEDRQRRPATGPVRSGDGLLGLQKLGASRSSRIRRTSTRCSSCRRRHRRCRPRAARSSRRRIVIQFFPNSDDIEKMIEKTVDGKTVQERYDPNVRLRGRGSGQARRAVRRGAHRDRGPHRWVDAQRGWRDRGRRAGAVAAPRERGEAGARAQVPTLQPNQFTTAGRGWDRPADPSDPNNHAKNRRVEIKVYPLEAK